MSKPQEESEESVVEVEEPVPLAPVGPQLPQLMDPVHVPDPDTAAKAGKKTE